MVTLCPVDLHASQTKLIISHRKERERQNKYQSSSRGRLFHEIIMTLKGKVDAAKTLAARVGRTEVCKYANFPIIMNENA